MSQSKAMSLVEVCTTTLVGYLVSVGLGQWFVYGWFGYNLTWTHNFSLTAIFVGVSMVIKFGFRRYFNWRQDNRGT